MSQQLLRPCFPHGVSPKLSHAVTFLTVSLLVNLHLTLLPPLDTTHFSSLFLCQCALRNSRRCLWSTASFKSLQSGFQPPLIYEATLWIGCMFDLLFAKLYAVFQSDSPRDLVEFIVVELQSSVGLMFLLLS